MIKVAICDDDAAEAGRIENFVRTYGDFDISVYTNSRKLGWVIEDGADFDLYLLDVVMPNPDGIELARLIRKSDKTAAIIYLTSHNERALEAFHVHASQYLIKPVSYETLCRELDSVLTAVKSRNAKTFLIKTKDGTEAVPFHKIVCCELVNRTLCCITADGEKHRSVTLRTSFKESVSQLCTDSRFIYPHMSFVVNMDYVKSMQGNLLVMNTGADIPITRRAVSNIKEKYLEYFFGGEQE